MNNPIAIMRLFRADRLRRQHRELRQIRILPGSAEKPPRPAGIDADTAVFVACGVLGVVTFWLSVMGVF